MQSLHESCFTIKDRQIVIRRDFMKSVAKLRGHHWDKVLMCLYRNLCELSPFCISFEIDRSRGISGTRTNTETPW